MKTTITLILFTISASAHAEWQMRHINPGSDYQPPQYQRSQAEVFQQQVRERREHQQMMDQLRQQEYQLRQLESAQQRRPWSYGR